MLELWNKIKGGGITVTGAASGIVGLVVLQWLNARGAEITNEQLLAVVAGFTITVGVCRRMYNFARGSALLLLILGASTLGMSCSTFEVEFSDNAQTGTNYKSRLNVAPFGKLGEGIAAMGYNWDQAAGEISVGQNVKDVDNTAQVDVVRIAVEAAIMAAQMYATSGASAAIPKRAPVAVQPERPIVVELPPPPVEPVEEIIEEVPYEEVNP